MTGPLSHLASNISAVDSILNQAQRLTNNLIFAFDTPSGIPSNILYFNPPRTDGATTNGIATIGTLVLEFTHLSDLTGNKTYGVLAQKGEAHLLHPRPASSEPWPGLIGMNVDINTGRKPTPPTFIFLVQTSHEFWRLGFPVEHELIPNL